jgi:hypothetical protein
MMIKAKRQASKQIQKKAFSHCCMVKNLGLKRISEIEVRAPVGSPNNLF